LAFVIGQTVGGLIVHLKLFGLTWQPIFLINIPLGLAAIVGALLFLKETRQFNPPPLDLGGVVLCSVALFALVYPLTSGREQGWPVWMILLLSAFPILFWIFLSYERKLARRGGAPLVQVSLLRRPALALGTPIAIGFYTSSGLLLTISVFLHNGLGFDPLRAGLMLLPLSVVYFLSSLLSAAAVRRFGPLVLVFGLILKAAGYALIAAGASGLPLPTLSIGLALVGSGFGMIMPTIVAMIVHGVDAEHAGLASGITMSSLQVGNALGVAILGGIFFTVLGHHQDLAAYRHAFAFSTLCGMAILAVAALLAYRFAQITWRVAA
jgi:MFS family permease